MHAPSGTTHTVADPRLVSSYLLREIVALVVVAALLFGLAGTLAWSSAWAMLAVTAAWSAGMAIIILRRNPTLLAERMGVRPNSKRWDRWIMSLHGLLQLATFILAGLDRRFGWADTMPGGVQAGALIACAAGYAFFLWAVASNPFFSQVVRLQTDRGHEVVRTGPYRFIRHPGYVGGVFTQLGVPLLLGSWPAAVAGLLDTLLLIARTSLEDRTLHAELPGYADYARQVRHRLLPGVW
jgi:protein-S-isoprenylcysteine O-methyltransferase Ste14